MKLRPSHALALACLASQSLFAQEAPEEIPPPKFPLKLRTSDHASWTIKKENKRQAIQTETEAGAKPLPFVKELSVIKTFPIYFERASLEDGRSWEKWIFVTEGGTYRLIKHAGSQKWERLWETYYQDISRYETSDFEDIEWVAKSNYRGVQAIDQDPAYAFQIESASPLTRRDQRNVTVAEGGGGQGQIFRSSAWIHAETLLPLKIDNDYETATITYGEAPASRLTPPAEVLAELKTWVKDVQQANR